MDRRFLIVAVCAAALLLILILTRRSKKMALPEEAVRARLSAAIDAVENRDLGDVMDVVSERFQGKGMDRAGVKRRLGMYMQFGGWRKVAFKDPVVQVLDPRRVEVTLVAVLASGKMAPDRMGVYHFQLTFELEDDDEWRVTSGDYQPARLGDLGG